MKPIRVLPTEKLSSSFVPAEFLAPGQDEYFFRNQQVGKPPDAWRHLRADEIETLVKNANTCDDWDRFLVSDPFTPQLVKNCEFYGLVRLGRLERVMLEHHELRIPAGLTDSLIISCDIGDNPAVHNVRYLAHYIVGDCALLLNIAEMNTTNHAKFGNGIIKDGEPEDVRIWIDLMNEAGGRSVMPFDGMTSADAYLWAKYRDDARLIERLGEFTQRQTSSRRGYYGTVGDQCVIKNCGIIKDVKFGPHAYVKGANKLKNLTINSSEEEPSQIGEGVELVNGIVGLGCNIFYGCKAVRFVMGNNAKLKYGARLIHSYLGDNSTVSCCELLNNLVFPAHEQHHNNSFLTATLVMGQSNIAAGVTIGSNHNSRANDGEIVAGRGFWPGLCTTLKHNCRFASFVLLVKGDYPYHLDVRLPFALVSDDPTRDRLLVTPAYWWRYNMYALARNTWKFQSRDTRKTKSQKIEFDCFAPDTAEEMFAALRLLAVWTGRAKRRAKGVDCPHDDEESLARLGRTLLAGDGNEMEGLSVLADGVEGSQRPVLVRRAAAGYHAYREMLHAYAMKNLMAWLEIRPDATLADMTHELAGPRETEWVNLGGQLVRSGDLDALRSAVGQGRLDSWSAIHGEYERLWAQYSHDKQRHAYATLAELRGCESLDQAGWHEALDEALRIQKYVCEQVLLTRKKDFDDPFRRITYRNEAEMQAVLGRPDSNSFVKQVQRETDEFGRRVAALRVRVAGA